MSADVKFAVGIIESHRLYCERHEASVERDHHHVSIYRCWRSSTDRHRQPRPGCANSNIWCSDQGWISRDINVHFWIHVRTDRRFRVWRIHNRNLGFVHHPRSMDSVHCNHNRINWNWRMDSRSNHTENSTQLHHPSHFGGHTNIGERDSPELLGCPILQYPNHADDYSRYPQPLHSSNQQHHFLHFACAENNQARSKQERILSSTQTVSAADSIMHKRHQALLASRNFRVS
jgi:hypothetical protein